MRSRAPGPRTQRCGIACGRAPRTGRHPDKQYVTAHSGDGKAGRHARHRSTNRRSWKNLDRPSASRTAAESMTTGSVSRPEAIPVAVFRSNVPSSRSSCRTPPSRVYSVTIRRSTASSNVRAHRPAGVARPRRAPAVGRRLARERAPSHASRLTIPCTNAEADDWTVSTVLQALSRSTANVGETPRGTRQREIDVNRSIGRRGDVSIRW
jgi:hypothetical protein